MSGTEILKKQAVVPWPTGGWEENEFGRCPEDPGKPTKEGISDSGQPSRDTVRENGWAERSQITFQG